MTLTGIRRQRWRGDVQQLHIADSFKLQVCLFFICVLVRVCVLHVYVCVCMYVWLHVCMYVSAPKSIQQHQTVPQDCVASTIGAKYPKIIFKIAICLLLDMRISQNKNKILFFSTVSVLVGLKIKPPLVLLFCWV